RRRPRRLDGGAILHVGACIVGRAPIRLARRVGGKLHHGELLDAARRARREQRDEDEAKPPTVSNVRHVVLQNVNGTRAIRRRTEASIPCAGGARTRLRGSGSGGGRGSMGATATRELRRARRRGAPSLPGSSPTPRRRGSLASTCSSGSRRTG